MNSTSRFRSLAAAAVGLFFAFSAIAADFPTELKLTNGATLRNVSVVRMEKDRIILKHAGGIDPIRFSQIDPVQRGEILGEPNKAYKYGGEVFVVTRGAGNYKLGGIEVSVFNGVKSSYGQSMKATKAVRTDSDGKFAFDWTGDAQFFLIVKATRRISGETEVYSWKLDRYELSPVEHFQLSNHNME